jgi:hypothetical protein
MATSAFVSDRTDGLGERLRALTNAIYLANRYNARMFYEWKNRQGGTRIFHSIEEEFNVFSQDFIDLHSYSTNEAELSRLDHVVELGDFCKQGGYLCLSENLRIRVNQSPVYRYIPETKAHYVHGGFKEAFSKVRFCNQISERIDYAQKAVLPEKATAFHLRAGDIIYGNGTLNKSARFCGKGIPWEIADLIIGRIRSEGGNVVLFGQDTSLLSYLAAKHHAYLATAFLDPDAKTSIEIAIQEILLMSRCARILAGSSGFAFLSSSLAGETHQPISRLEISPVATVLSRLSHQLDQSISVEQRVFSLRWVIGMHGHELSPKELLEVAHHGLSLLPNDLFFILTKASALNALDLASEASKIITFALSSYSVPELTRMLSPSAFGKPASHAHLLSLLTPQIPRSILEN